MRKFKDFRSRIIHRDKPGPVSHSKQSPDPKTDSISGCVAPKNEKQNIPAMEKTTTDLDKSPQSPFDALWRDAFEAYFTSTKRTPVEKDELKELHNLDDLQKHLEKDKGKFNQFRAKHSKVTGILKAVLEPFMALSGVASSALSMTPYAPASVILGGVLFLFTATENVSKVYDCIETLFEKLTTFSNRLSQYVDNLPLKLKENAVDILCCLLEILGYSETAISRGRYNEYICNIFSSGRIKSPYEKLEKLLDIEQRLVPATILGQTLNTAKKVENIDTTVQDNRRETILEWLLPKFSAVDFPARQKALVDKRHEGTGQWFLKEPKFTKWLDEPKSSLFCHGIAGAGKSVLAATTVDHILNLETREHLGLGYLFCNHKDQIDASVLLAALLQQLSRQCPVLDELISQLYVKHVSTGTLPSRKEYFTVLQTILTKFSTVYIVLDSIDECSNQDSTRDQLLINLRNLQQHADLRLMVTSRSIPSIRNKFPSTPTMEIRAISADIELFVHSQRDHLPQFIQDDDILMGRVTKGIVEGVGGMFLLARLWVESFRDKHSIGQVESALSRLEDHSQSPEELLHEAYNDAISRIGAQSPNDITLAKSALSWITCAQRSLTTVELCHALAVYDELADRDSKKRLYRLEDINVGYIPKADYIISVCAGLVTIDGESDVIRLVHSTTQEYFEKVLNTWNPLAQEKITLTCLTYLSFKDFESGSCDYNEFHTRRKQYPLLDYAAQHWGNHAETVQEQLSDLAARFLQDSGLVDCAVQIMYSKSWDFHGNPIFPKQTTWLHLTARFGLLHLSKVSPSLSKASAESCADLKDSYNRTPLSYAAEHGHEAVIKLLLECGKVKADSKDLSSRTPLSWAAAAGHEAVVRLLVEREDVKANKEDNWGRTPLSWAAENGHEAVVRLLIQRDDVEVDLKDTTFGQTPLSWAAGNGHEAVVRLLVEREDVKADLKDRTYGQTPLSWAAEYGHEAVVRLLIQRDDVEVDLKDTTLGQTPLSLAARHGREAVVRLLIQHEVETGKVDVNSKDAGKRTPLMWATMNGHEAVVKLLRDAALAGSEGSA